MAAETQKPKAEVFACCHKSNLQLSALFLYDFLKKICPKSKKKYIIINKQKILSPNQRLLA